VKKPASPQKPQRCAIYTRKSTEHNLDLAFNSLDAQREACEAYIKSQSHEGWKLIPTHFDDGGLSGASLDRPALQNLLDQVRVKRIDIVVVYKVDRLTRSLADFAKLVELFDEHEVSFVSVTQSFNTTSSMGRLTLNVLLSFAQFEREVIGERVRDKIAASKRKGIWVGGSIPLGYRSVDKKLEVVPKEAETVRRIFGLYIEVGSVGDLARVLEREGIRPKPRRLANGRTKTAERYTVGPLAHMRGAGQADPNLGLSQNGLTGPRCEPAHAQDSPFPGLRPLPPPAQASSQRRGNRSAGAGRQAR
jgi:site-specific DNA recombinase